MNPRIPLPLALLASGLLVACGGGGGSAPGATAPTVTRTTGIVTRLDGQTADRSGVAFLATTTGASSTTAADGRFDLGLLPAGQNQIWVTPPATTPLERASRAPVELSFDTSGSGRLVLRLVIEDGVIRRLDMDMCDGEHSQEVTASLTALEPGLEGKVKVKRDDDGDQDFEVEVEDLIVGRTIEIRILDPDTGASESLGLFAAGDDGEVEIELDTGDGARLPFAVADVGDLAGFGVEVLDGATAALLLEGTVPDIGAPSGTCDDDDDSSSDDDSLSDDDDSSSDSGDDSSGSGSSGSGS